MRALHLLKTAEGAVWAVKQIRELILLGVHVDVILPREGPRHKDLVEVGARCHFVDLDGAVKRPHRLAKAHAALHALVQQTRPDLIHSHFVSTTLAARTILGRAHPIPRIFQVPGPLHLENTAVRRLDLSSAGPRDHWIASSWYTFTRYRRLGAPPSSLSCSYYGFDIDQFGRPGDGRLRAELHARGLPDVPILGMVAYFYPPRRLLGHHEGIKGHETFLDALAVLMRRRPLIAVFVGGASPGADGEYAQRVQERARGLCGNHAVFLGPRDDVPTLYPEFTLSVAPSHSENLGSAGESMASRVLTVASRTGGLPELVNDDWTGYLSQPTDPVSLAGRIEVALALEDPERSAMLDRAQRLARKVLDVRRTAKEVHAIYEQVLTAGRQQKR